MATKAHLFRSETERSASAKEGKAAPASHDPAGKRARQRGRIKERLPNPTSHNEAPRAAKNSAYALEVSATSRPSRKSTRRSPTHVKTDSALRITAMNETISPQARAQRRTSPNAQKHLARTLSS